MLLYAAGDGVVRAFYNVYLDTVLGLTTPAIGGLYGAAMLVATLTALAAPIAIGRWGQRRSFVVATVGMAVSALPLALVRHWAGAAIGIVCITALALIARPIITIYQMEIVSPRWRAAMSAAGTMGRAFRWAAASLAGGFLVAAVGYQGFFLAGGAATALGAALFWAFDRRGTRRRVSRELAGPSLADGQKQAFGLPRASTSGREKTPSDG
jgi:predicted MFS family arabinose efflux permease